MDPETAVDIMRDYTRDAERLLHAATRVSTKERANELHVLAREALQAAGASQYQLFMWLSQGGFRPPRFDTWLKRYIAADHEWRRQSDML